MDKHAVKCIMDVEIRTQHYKRQTLVAAKQPKCKSLDGEATECMLCKQRGYMLELIAYDNSEKIGACRSKLTLCVLICKYTCYFGVVAYISSQLLLFICPLHFFPYL